MKLLIVALCVGLLIYLILRPFLLSQTRKGRDDDNVSEMRECANCGVFVDISESFIANGAYFCSKECLKKSKK